SVQRRQHRCGAPATERKAQEVQMGMNDIEVLGLRPQGVLLHEHERRIAFDEPGFETERMRAGGPEASHCLGIAAGKECDVMALANEFFRDIRDNSLGTTV